MGKGKVHYIEVLLNNEEEKGEIGPNQDVEQNINDEE